MSFLGALWNRIKGRDTVTRRFGVLPEMQVLDDETVGTVFNHDEGYFEVRVAEHFLKKGRNWHKEYTPLSMVLADFLYDGEVQSFPGLVGPSRLRDNEFLEGDDDVVFRNIRVLGPAPYRGDGLNLLAGFFRVESRDWAYQTISLLEGVAKAFDATKLSQFVTVAEPLTESIDGFLGNDDTQFRLGAQMGFADPTAGTNHPFRSGYLVFMRAPEDQLDLSDLWVKGGRLHTGPSADDTRPYRDDDFMLLHIAHLTERSDHERFDFHADWKKTLKAIYEQGPDAAKPLMRKVVTGIRTSPDLISSHRETLSKLYAQKFHREVERASFESFGPERVEARTPISEDDIAHALAHPEDYAHVSAEI